jgi:membrane protease YdiL (CAAX protease family)
MVEAIRRRPLTAFYLIAFVLGALFIWMRALDPGAMAWAFKDMKSDPWHPNIISVFPKVLERPALVSGYLFPAAPMFAALIVAAWIGGRRGLGELLDRFRPWREGVGWRQGLMVYALCFAVYMACIAVLVIMLHLRGPDSGLSLMLQRYGTTTLGIVAFMLVAPFLGPGGLLEELGWRGFALPLLLERLKNPLLATVVLGVLWGLWHLPRDVPGLLSGNPALIRGGSYAGYLLSQLQFVSGTVIGSIIITYVFFKTGGSWWSAMLVHNFFNEFSVGLTMLTRSSIEIAGMAFTPGGVFQAILAGLILAFTGTQLGRRPPAQAGPAGLAGPSGARP